jgi:hypothetical protein
MLKNAYRPARRWMVDVDKHAYPSMGPSVSCCANTSTVAVHPRWQYAHSNTHPHTRTSFPLSRPPQHTQTTTHTPCACHPTLLILTGRLCALSLRLMCSPPPSRLSAWKRCWM